MSTATLRAEPAEDRPAAEARSGLDPWVPAELPAPPAPTGLGWLAVVGPGVIVLGASIGSGEFLLGPAVFVRHGLSLLWVTTVAVVLQTIFNTEVMRYTLATGEPVFTGFMRTRPSSTLWAWLYAVLYFLQVGWPAWAGTAAGGDLLPVRAASRRAGGRRRRSTTSASATFLACVAVLSVGRRIERTLELLNWVLVVVHPRRLPRAGRAASFPRRRGSRRRPGSAGFDAAARHVRLLAGGDGLLPARRARGVFRVRRRRQPHAVELGARQGLRHGRARGLHPRRGRRPTRCTSRTAASSSRPTPRPCAAGAGGGASSAPTSGACSSPARSSAWCFRRCCT